MRSTMFELCILCVVIFAPLAFAYDCKIEYGKEPNLEDHGCESYWDCHKSQGTLKQCLGSKQFDFKLKECMPNSEVWCQWQHKQIREMRSGSGRTQAQKPKIQHVHHVPKPRKDLGSRRVVKVIKVKSPGHSHDHEHEDGTVHSHPHGHDDHHHDHGHHEPNIVTSFIHSHDGSIHKHLVDENGQFVDSTDHYHLKKEDEADYHDSSDYHDYSSDYHDTPDDHHPRPRPRYQGRGKGGIGYGKFQDGGSDLEPEIVKTVTHTHDGSTHTHFVDDKGDYSYDYDPDIIYKDDYHNKNYEYYDDHYDESGSNHVDMDYDVDSHEDPHDSDYKGYEYDYNSQYDYNYDYDDVISWGYMCASKFSHEPNIKDSKCKTFYRCDNYKGTKIFCKPDHLYDFHAKACRYHNKVDCHHQMHDYEKDELKHHIEIEKKDNGMTIIHHYYHGGKKGLGKH